MSPLGRRLALVAALGLAAPAGGCVLCKPVVGALVGPVVFLGRGNGNSFGSCHGDARGLLAAYAVLVAAGAVCGLVTGAITDVRVVCGCEPDPLCNWWDPFAVGAYQLGR
jgi:hypothetical protein